MGRVMVLVIAGLCVGVTPGALVFPGCEDGDYNASRGPVRFSVTLVSQSTSERLWNFGGICERWKGPISVAILVKEEALAPSIKAEARDLMRPCGSSVAVATVFAGAGDEGAVSPDEGIEIGSVVERRLHGEVDVVEPQRRARQDVQAAVVIERSDVDGTLPNFGLAVVAHHVRRRGARAEEPHVPSPLGAPFEPKRPAVEGARLEGDVPRTHRSADAARDAERPRACGELQQPRAE